MKRWQSERTVKRILLVVDDCQSGDALRILPFLRKIREQHPEAYCVLLTNEEVLPVVEHADVYDRVVLSAGLFSLHSTSLPKLIHKTSKAIQVLRQIGSGYDLVITFWWGTTLLHVLGLLAGWRGRRVGYSRRLPQLLTCRLGPFNVHEGYNRQHGALLKAAGIEMTDVTAATFDVKREDDAHIQQVLVEHGIPDTAPLIVLHSGSDWACQQWRQERWAALADELVRRFRATIVFTGLERESGYIRDIQRRMIAPSYSLAGCTPIPLLAALLARASLCVCIDSMVFELSQAVGIPAVVLAGPTAPGEVIPGVHRPLIVKQMDTERVLAIHRCKVTILPGQAPTKREDGCQLYQCPMAGLTEITVPEILTAVDGHLSVRVGVDGER